MKKMRVMAAIVTVTATLAMGVIPVCAADNSQQDVQALKAAIAADTEVQSEIVALATETTTTNTAFNWGGLVLNQTGDLSAAAYKVDLSETSMANNSLDTGSTVVLTSNGYEFTVKTKAYSYMGSTAEPKTAAVTYYAAEYDEEGVVEGYREVTENCTVSDNTITFTIPADAQGLTSTDKGIPTGYNNMIKVKMTTTLEDTLLGNLFPEAMKNPTFFYAFNVTAK